MNFLLKRKRSMTAFQNIRGLPSRTSEDCLPEHQRTAFQNFRPTVGIFFKSARLCPQRRTCPFLCVRVCVCVCVCVSVYVIIVRTGRAIAKIKHVKKWCFVDFDICHGMTSPPDLDLLLDGQKCLMIILLKMWELEQKCVGVLTFAIDWFHFENGTTWSWSTFWRRKNINVSIAETVRSNAKCPKRIL